MSVDPLTADFFDILGAPLNGLTPSFADDATYNGYWKTAAGIDASPPVVTGGGDGDYVFTPSATDLATGIRYRLDGGPTAFPRYAYGVIESNASAAVQTTVDPEDLNLFGVTPAAVKSRHFPQWGAFTTGTNPSLATVLEIIDEQAAVLEGKLAAESIAASAITIVNSGAYLWCRKALRLMVALEILPIATQQVPPLSNKWQEKLDAMWKDLDEKGELALGSGVSAPAVPPDGPTTHINTYSIDVGDIAGDASTSVPRLRRDDQL